MTESFKAEYDKLVLAGEIERARKLIADNLPSGMMIYKYFTGNNRNFNTIRNNQVWLSSACYLNDPYDSSFFLNVTTKKRYKKSESELASSEYFKQRKQDIASKIIQKSVLISAFSETKQSILMWSHYAKEHKGLCVAYDLSELIKKVDIMPVVYSRFRPKIDESEEKNIYMAALIKAEDWSYEKEWRIIRIQKEEATSEGELVEVIPPIAIFCGDKIWNSIEDNYNRASKASKVICNKDNQPCSNTRRLITDEDAAVDINHVMKYARDTGVKLYLIELSRDAFELKAIQIRL